jgi:hypothetical protein
VPRARPPEVRQEHPVPIGGALLKAQVRTDVAQYPPTVDATGPASGSAQHRKSPQKMPTASDKSNDLPARWPAIAREDHCTVPRARPPGVLQEHPVPTGAEVVKAQVRTEVTQYPPDADATGVWYVEYGYP